MAEKHVNEYSRTRAELVIRRCKSVPSWKIPVTLVESSSLQKKRKGGVEQMHALPRRGSWVIMLTISSNCHQQEVASTFSCPVSQGKWEKEQITLDKCLRKVASFLRKLGFNQGWDVQRSCSRVKNTGKFGCMFQGTQWQGFVKGRPVSSGGSGPEQVTVAEEYVGQRS